MSETPEIRDDGAMEQLGRFARHRLELAFPPKLFMHDFMPPRLTTKVWGDLLRRTPFVGLGWSKLGPKPGTPSGQFIGNASWSAFLVVKNPGGHAARLFGDRQGPGLLKMVRAAVAVLHGAKVPGVGTIQVTDSGNAYPDNYEDEALSMAAIDFECQLGINLAGTLSGIYTPALTEIDITWSFAGDSTDTLVDTNETGAS